MTVKELKEALVNIPDNYKVVADDGMGMENGSPVDAVVIMDYYNKICMATGFETEDTIIKKNEALMNGLLSNSLPNSNEELMNGFSVNNLSECIIDLDIKDDDGNKTKGSHLYLTGIKKKVR